MEGLEGEALPPVSLQQPQDQQEECRQFSPSPAPPAAQPAPPNLQNSLSPLPLPEIRPMGSQIEEQ